MHFFVAILLVVSLIAPILGLPGPRTIQKFKGETSGKYIVKFKDGAARKTFIKKHGLGAKVVEWEHLNGFSGHLNASTIETLLLSNDVEYISEDGALHTMVTQTNAPWGISRISQDARLSSTSVTALTYTYTYNATAGAGVDIYIVDTGVYTAHSDFGGRARWGASFNGYGTADGNGHGTHCAGIAAGARYGVAKAANIIAVKVLDDSGSGYTSTIVSGLNWVLAQAQASGRPSIVSLSLGGGVSTALDSSIAILTDAGIHIVVAAGNANADAVNYSPARAPSAVTVGATTITDARASYSNYGSVVDIFAPGTSITSTWIGSTTSTNIISGTSMATPHITGLIAYFIAMDGNLSPAAMTAKLQSLSVKDALSGIPAGTVNYLANNK